MSGSKKKSIGRSSRALQLRQGSCITGAGRTSITIVTTYRKVKCEITPPLPDRFRCCILIIQFLIPFYTLFTVTTQGQIGHRQDSCLLFSSNAWEQATGSHTR